MDRITTGNPNLDTILDGGLPRNSLIIIAGAPGTGKTILAQQFVFANTTTERPAVYLTTLCEPAPKLIRHLQPFTFYDEDKLFGTPAPIHYHSIAQDIKARGFEYLPELIAQIIRDHQPAYLVVDSFKALRDLGADSPRFRQVLFDLAGTLAAYACTTLLVGEYSGADIDVLPEFALADGAIYLINQKHGMRDERYLRVVKLRGSGYRSGEHAFRISERGLDVYPRLVTPFPPTPYAVTAERLGTGVPDLDAMLGGGLWRGSTTLLAGPAGSGKTILGLHFLFDGVARGEPGLLVSFQESPTALRRTVAGLGWDPAPLAEGGLLAVLASSPVEMNVDDIVGQAEQTIAARSIRRVVIDSLGDLEAAARDRDRFRGYVYSMLRSLAARNITTYLTFETRVEADLGRLTELHVSYLCDNALGLRYDVADGGLRRTIAVVKSRGSAHSHRVRRFTITDRGIVLDGHVGGEGQRRTAGRE